MTATNPDRKNRKIAGAGSSRPAKKQHATVAINTAFAPSCHPDAIHRLHETITKHIVDTDENSMKPWSTYTSPAFTRQW
ncbi:hypothetical protein LMG29739_00764 [Paraburkholderia solisilvae]|uniref:Uncharacterized protein n=1 Tax=Paraburkholderia solisilvae TaxID=624376 RepID=A0A6J5D7J8_9BURK|nr:hypothetical protein LMG29739_00764 [Paraburkholderia solisilvae]